MTIKSALKYAPLTLIPVLAAALFLWHADSARGDGAAATKPASAAATTAPASTVTKADANVSYAIGVSIAKSFKSQEVEVDLDAVVKGLKDELAGKLSIPEANLQNVLGNFQQELMRKRMKALRQAAEDNQKAGAAFLAANAKKKGVTTTASGLQYKVIKAGTGPKPTAEDTVSVNYKGTLINGKLFDASPEGAPVPMELGRVIPGWQEALKLMPVGSKWEIVVPAQLAYRPSSPDAKIPPNSVLLFDIELVGIVDK